MPSVALPKSGLFRLMRVLFSRYGCAPSWKRLSHKGQFLGICIRLQYLRVDAMRTAPVLDDATRRVASVSLAQMAPALAWFISCNVDALGVRKK